MPLPITQLKSQNKRIGLKQSRDLDTAFVVEGGGGRRRFHDQNSVGDMSLLIPYEAPKKSKSKWSGDFEERFISELMEKSEKSTSTGTQKQHESLGWKLSTPQEMWNVADPAKQILIVEDNKYSAYALMSLLEQYSLEVHLAMNGKEAADLVKLRH